jgi:hypothetical protein
VDTCTSTKSAISTPRVAAVGAVKVYEANLNLNWYCLVAFKPVILGSTYQSCSIKEDPFPAPNNTALSEGVTEALAAQVDAPPFGVKAIAGFPPVNPHIPGQLQVSILSNSIIVWLDKFKDKNRLKNRNNFFIAFYYKYYKIKNPSSFC